MSYGEDDRMCKACERERVCVRVHESSACEIDSSSFSKQKVGTGLRCWFVVTVVKYVGGFG